jgi:hypothetical protein
MDSTKVSAPAHDHEHDGQDDRVHACIAPLGVVYVGHLVVGDDGEEVEIYEAVRCERCGRA